jgi:hypothetical protein
VDERRRLLEREITHVALAQVEIHTRLGYASACASIAGERGAAPSTCSRSRSFGRG